MPRASDPGAMSLYTFVAVDQLGAPSWCRMVPESEEEQRRFEGACAAVNSA